MREKLLQFMKSEGLTSSRLAEILEIQPSAISHILSGRNKPGFELLQKILRRFPRVNPDWLLLDSDQMYRDPIPSATDPQSGSRQQAAKTSAADSLFPASLSEAPSAPSPQARPDMADLSSAVLNGAAPGAPKKAAERIILLHADGTYETFILEK